MTIISAVIIVIIIIIIIIIIITNIIIIMIIIIIITIHLPTYLNEIMYLRYTGILVIPEARISLSDVNGFLLKNVSVHWSHISYNIH